MKITTNRVLDQLPVDEPCLGAAFTSYTFDPRFFEEHALRSILRLTADPVEEATRYHDEARRALQATPVVTFVDAGERQPGRRLPYDLVQISEMVFHPKSVLLLFDKKARLMVGSGNLTFPGFGGNSELFLSLDLSYEDAEDVAILRAHDAHLVRCLGFGKPSISEQFRLLRDALHRRLPEVTETVESSDLALLDSTTAPILDQLLALLPEDATIERVGMLAPFFERDDGGSLDASIFGPLANRASATCILDIGVAWENQIGPPPTKTPIVDGLGRLWAWSWSPDDAEHPKIDYVIPSSIGVSEFRYVDQRGNQRRWNVEDTHDCVEDRSLWMVPKPVAFAPEQAIEATKQLFQSVRLWLCPAVSLVDGRPQNRPLHAKLLALGYRVGRTEHTLVLVGSANMSRRALLLRAGHGMGNVELGVAFRLKGLCELTDLAPQLVLAPNDLELEERQFPELGPNHALAIEDAVHDPAARTLVITWSEAASLLPTWRLTYNDQLLAEESTAPNETIRCDDFVLHPASAEVQLNVDGNVYAAPIRVTDLVALPAGPGGRGLGLEELLMLMGRRIGTERAVQIANKRSSADNDDSELAAFLGEGFGPDDVFRAWRALAEELSDPAVSLPSFRLQLEGAMGAAAIWSAMLHAASSSQSLQPVEAWFYGAELQRFLSRVEIADGYERSAKLEMLGLFRERVGRDMSALEFEGKASPWVQKIRSFYGEVSS